jgi:hypothetical protein
MYPLVPLLPGGGLGIALFSYEGRLCWGFNADWELVPDLRAFVADLGASFEELRAAAVARFLEARTAAPETAASEPAPEPAAPAPKLRAYRGARAESPGEPAAASAATRRAVAGGSKAGKAGAVEATRRGPPEQSRLD